MRRGRAPFFLAVSGAASLAACASIVGFEEPDYVDAGAEASVEASSSDAFAEGALDVDVKADATPNVPTFCSTIAEAGVDGGAVIFCDDFERSTALGSGWSTVVTKEHEALELTDAQAFAGSQSLLTALGAGQNDAGRSAFLTRDFDAGGFPVFLELDIYVDETQEYGPGGEYSGFLFAVLSAGSDFFPIASGAVGDAGWNPYLPGNPDGIVTLALRQWHHVVYRIDEGGLTADFTPAVDGGATTTRTRNVKIDAPPHSFWVGSDVGTGGGPVRLYIDDVVVHR